MPTKTKSKPKILKVEIDQSFVKAEDTLVSDQIAVMVTPPVGEDYWLGRVQLGHGQAIIAFPKFGTIGCGFAKEEDWNTNLPLEMPAEEIFSHIQHNKKFESITDADCLRAIRLLQETVLPIFKKQG